MRSLSKHPPGQASIAFSVAAEGPVIQSARRCWASLPAAALMLLLALALVFPARGQEAFATRPLSALGTEAPARGSSTPVPACENGVVVDDGSLESGYGWVPSVVDGRYVQEFASADFVPPGLASACVCWTRTREQDTVDFFVELYRLTEDGPLAIPEVSVPARAEAVPTFPDGAFYEVDISSPPLPRGTFVLGVRWNPSVDQFFFVCADQSPETPFVNGWLIDDRASGWGQFFESSDSILADHSALLLRAVAGDPVFPIEIPTLRGVGLLALGLLLGVAGLIASRQR